eukprot:CAMPEP_0173436920 /NCGR_PEP_ID=MMETSP1357-20121228/17597_1 /TAXON_ID=77926 /ORGANISM="Hemiselmis rufescens, Strain PCC563" /LENGTH=416 /DNA_ID=CAMNT_0014402071 /DNA_START=6 /DNA_END=1256 /DNA_ORIENTATION=+
MLGRRVLSALRPALGRAVRANAFPAMSQTVFGARGLKSQPHGGKLVNRMVGEAEGKEAIKACNGLTMELSERQSCDVELINVGAFSPLEGFMNEDAWTSVLQDMKLPGSGLLFGLPVVLDTNRDDLTPGKKVTLTYQGIPLAVLDIESRWKPNKALECKLSYGFTTLEHPGVRMISMERGHTYIGGKLTGLAIPKRPFPSITPADTRAALPTDKDVVAFQCRNPIHRAHYELFIRALDAPNVEPGSVVLVHPTCGPTQEDDIDGVTRYKTYEVLKAELDNPKVHWSYLPYSMHMAGPREAIQHMLIRKNYGCTHFIIGRDMAGCKSSLTGEDYYGTYDAQDLARANCDELGMQVVPSLDLVSTEQGYTTVDEAKAKGLKVNKLSGTEFRKRLRAGEDIPEWFAFKSVVKVLRDATK